jgi:hypothetical protein
LDILSSIDVELLYHTHQLWSAFERNDVNEWLTHLGKLAFMPANEPLMINPFDKNNQPKPGKEKIQEAYFKWISVIGDHLRHLRLLKIKVLNSILTNLEIFSRLKGQKTDCRT